ncbi:hypothetical protein L0F63_004186 [Massospora cicadina]|nr:hypothetical protein L0F63_004186 [Massospora cicadina]
MIEDQEEIDALTSNMSLVSDIMLSEVLQGPEMVENIIEWVGYEEGEGWVGTKEEWPVIGMGHTANIYGFNINTARFRDNCATRVQIEACLQNEAGNEVWRKLLDTQSIRPMSSNFFAYKRGRLLPYSKLRLNVVGGISLLKVYGRVLPPKPIDYSNDPINLSAIENGGRVIDSSDNLAHPERLLLSTKDEAQPWMPSCLEGPDYVIIALAAPAYVKKMILASHSTASPHAAKIFACNSSQGALTKTTKWIRISSGLVLPNRNNRFDNFNRSDKITHLKLEFSPKTCLNQIKIMGWFIHPEIPFPTHHIKDEILLSDESESELDEVEADETPSDESGTSIKTPPNDPILKLAHPEDPDIFPKAIDGSSFTFATGSRNKRTPVSTDFTFQMVLPQIKRNR